MFSSTNSLNPFPQQYYFSSSSPSLPPILNQEVVASDHHDINLFHHDPLSTPFLLNISPLIPETGAINLGVSNSAGTMSKQDMCNNLYNGGVPKFHSKKPTKKDRHSKIYTAQGLRDRRVRLSIEIAREFFDLQDMLGFDKASKTLEWLLTKSKKAIKDLARTKLSSSSSSCAIARSSSSLTWECEELEEEEEEEVADNDDENHLEEEEDEGEGVVVSKSKKVLKEKNMRKQLNEALMQHLRSSAKESRAKARARARERTMEKNFHDPKKSTTCHNQILNQLRTMNQLQAFHQRSPKMLTAINQPPPPPPPSSSIRIKRKLNVISSKGGDQTSNHDHNNINNNNNNNNNNMFCPNLPQNWDIISPLIPTTRPSFCAITNTNLSTEVQIYGKTMGGQ